MFGFSPLSTNFAIAVLSVYVALLMPETESWRIVKNVHDPHLDIALLYDQSSSMRTYINYSIWEEFAEWIDNYFRGFEQRKHETQFAVMGCGSAKKFNTSWNRVSVVNGTVEPVLYFNGDIKNGTINASSDPAVTVMAAHKYINNKIGGLWDNVDGCARSTVEKLFIEDKGDRPNASNVVFYITDCYLWQNTDVHKQYTSVLISKSKALLFICVCNTTGDQCVTDNKNSTHYKNMLSWVKNESLIFKFTNKTDLKKKLDEVLEVKDLNVTDCESNGTSRTGCTLQSDGSCVDIEYPNIVVEQTYSMYSNACEPNKTIVCNSIECTCEKNPWITKLCCDGSLVEWRIVYPNMPDCIASQTNANSNCTEPCKTTTEMTTSAETMTVGDGITTAYGTTETSVVTGTVVQKSNIGISGETTGWQTGEIVNGSTVAQKGKISISNETIGWQTGEIVNGSTVAQKSSISGETTGWQRGEGINGSRVAQKSNISISGETISSQSGEVDGPTNVTTSKPGSGGSTSSQHDGEKPSSTGTQSGVGKSSSDAGIDNKNKDKKEESSSADSTGIIVGSIVGVVLALIFLIVILVVVVRKKKQAAKGKEGKKGKGMSVGKKTDEKEKGMKVDLRGEDSMMMGSIHSKSLMSAEKNASVTSQGNKSVGGKGEKSTASVKGAKAIPGGKGVKSTADKKAKSVKEGKSASAPKKSSKSAKK